MSDNGGIALDWAFACDYALIDATGKISILGIFDKLYAAAFPGLHAQLYLVSSWLGPPGQLLPVEVRVWNPGQQLAGTMQQNVTLGPEGRSTGIFQIAPLPLPAPGEYVFEFLGAGVSAKQLAINVEAVPQQ